MIVEEKGSIPDTREELVIACLRKFLFVSSVSGPTLRACLRSRTANAANKAALFNAATDFLAQLEEYPQASRLFLLGLLRNMALFALRSSGGFHDAQRRPTCNICRMREHCRFRAAHTTCYSSH